MILDSTTGADASGLIIWNLQKKQKVFEGSWSEPEKSDETSLIYWLETEKATGSNCPQLKEWRENLLSGAIETKVIQALSTLKITQTRKMLCF